MTKPMRLSEFDRLAPVTAVRAVAGLASAIDRVAEAGPATHRFLRYGWFAAAIGAGGGRARTLVVEDAGLPVIALPMVPGRWPGLASVAGHYWPFRGFPARRDAGAKAYDALVRALAREVRVLRWGPVYDDDPVLAGTLAAARRRGWAVLDRWVAHSYRLDLAGLAAAGDYPRRSTLKKNRFHEKHLARHGAAEWRVHDGAGVTDALLDELAGIEARSWVGQRTDARDAKFMRAGHGGFWRRAAADPEVAALMKVATLRVGGRPAAFAFDLDGGTMRWAIANGYDPVVAKHSPGRLLAYRNIARAMAAGVRMIDWGAGDAGYKETMGAAYGPGIRDYLLVRPGVTAAAARAMAGWWRRSGQVPDAAAPGGPWPGGHDPAERR